MSSAGCVCFDEILHSSVLDSNYMLYILVIILVMTPFQHSIIATTDTDKEFRKIV